MNLLKLDLTQCNLNYMFSNATAPSAVSSNMPPRSILQTQLECEVRAATKSGLRDFIDG